MHHFHHLLFSVYNEINHHIPKKYWIFVDEQTTKYCVDEETCWTLEQCTTAFPNYFANSELDQIMRKFKLELQKHIDEALATTDSPISDAHDQIMETIRDNASRVIGAKQTFDAAVDAIIQEINNL